MSRDINKLQKEGILQEVSTLATFLTSVGTVLTSAIDWVGSCGQMVVNTPLLLVPTVLSLGLIGISIIKRFV